MRINLIAVHYGDINKKNIIGFRFLDSESGQVIDQPYTNVVSALKLGTQIIGLGLNNGSVIGTNGSLDRYPALISDRLINNGIVILNSIDDYGYRICNFKGTTMEITSAKLVSYANKMGISNGKLVTKDNKQYISAINGTYINVELKNSDSLYKEISNIRTNKQYADTLKKELIKKIQDTPDRDVRLPKVITGLKADNSRLKDFDEATGMTVEQKMAFVLMALRVARPFYYSILNILKRIEANEKDDVDTMAVTLDSLYFSPQFVLDTSLTDLLFIVIHEICHIAMRHRSRQGARDHDLWNVACDYFINKCIAEEFGLAEQGDLKDVVNTTKSIAQYKISLPTFVLYNSAINTKVDTPEKIYEELKSSMNSQDNQDSQGSQGSQGNQDGQDGQDGQGSQRNENKDDSNESDKNQDNAQGDSNETSELDEFSNGNNPNNTDKNDESSNYNESDSNESDNSEESDKGSTESASNTKSGNGRNGKPSRLAGKEFRGQKIPDIKPDMVDDAKTLGESQEKIEQIQESIVKRAVIQYKQSHSFGGPSAGLVERLVEKSLAPKVNWRTLIKNKLTLASQKINTFAAPDKRFRSRGMIMPGPKAIDNDSLDNVKLCIDTSGSITDKELGIALSQIEQLFKAYHVKAELLYWDTDIRAVYGFKDIKELLTKKPKGGGGTDVNCVFEYFETNRDYKIGKKKKPSIIIIFTDGYFGDVHSKYKKYRDTIWIIHDNDKFVAPFGTKAKFKND